MVTATLYMPHLLHWGAGPRAETNTPDSNNAQVLQLLLRRYPAASLPRHLAGATVNESRDEPERVLRSFKGCRLVVGVFYVDSNNVFTPWLVIIDVI